MLILLARSPLIFLGWDSVSGVSSCTAIFHNDFDFHLKNISQVTFYGGCRITFCFGKKRILGEWIYSFAEKSAMLSLTFWFDIIPHRFQTDHFRLWLNSICKKIKQSIGRLVGCQVIDNVDTCNEWFGSLHFV